MVALVVASALPSNLFGILPNFIEEAALFTAPNLDPKKPLALLNFPPIKPFVLAIIPAPVAPAPAPAAAPAAPLPAAPAAPAAAPPAALPKADLAAPPARSPNRLLPLFCTAVSN